MSSNLDEVVDYVLAKRGQLRTLEGMLTSADGFGLTQASPLQRAICRIVDGVPLGTLAEHEHVAQAVGDVRALPTSRPSEVCILSGIRTAKSMMAAALAIRASQTCDLSKLSAGETPRVSAVSLTTDLAKVVFDHVKGNVLSRPKLHALLLEEPTSDTVMLRHPSGRPVQIKIVAGARAGASLVARWSAGVIFDEAPRMVGQQDGVVNLDDLRGATIGRMLPGAQIVFIGSPWAPFGPVWEMVQEHFGKPSAQLVVIRAPAHHMNPEWWTEERREALRASDPTVYRTDVLGEFADPETALLSTDELVKSTRLAPAILPREPGHAYFAAMDPATRGNAWTLVVATRKVVNGRAIFVVALARQWVGSKASPLSPREVLRDVAESCRAYGLTSVASDQWFGDALRDMAREEGIHLLLTHAAEEEKYNRYKSFATRVSDGTVELPPDHVLRQDLQAIRKRVTQQGVSIVLPKTADGRHCDYAPAVTLALARYMSLPEDVAPVPGTTEASEKAMEDQLRKRHGLGKHKKAWWDR